MITLNPKVDLFLEEGCGRCSYHATPQCKVNTWRSELIALRQIVLDCGLTEELKWGFPTYTYKNKNLLMVSVFKEFSSISFFKGVLLQDPYKLLVQAGESSQSARLIKFTDTQTIQDNQDKIREYIFETIELEKAGAKVEFKKDLEPIPDELTQKFLELPALKEAFFALTPGKQRGYVIHFSQPKQIATRTSRIEKCIPQILNGIGFHDNYKK